jgi:hypothetical protein
VLFRGLPGGSTPPIYNHHNFDDLCLRTDHRTIENNRVHSTGEKSGISGEKSGMKYSLEKNEVLLEKHPVQMEKNSVSSSLRAATRHPAKA